jgi:hypothetical protein
MGQKCRRGLNGRRTLSVKEKIHRIFRGK